MSNPISQSQSQPMLKSGPKPVVIYGGPLIDGQGNVYPDGAVYISKGKVAAVGDEEKVFNQIPKGDNLEAYDTLGRVISPGLINLHQHSYYSLAVGLREFHHCGKCQHATQSYRPDFSQSLDDESIQLSLLLSIMQSVRSGVTTIFELHSSPPSKGEVLKNMASAIAQSGIRAVLSYEPSAINGAASFLQSIEEHQAFIQQYLDNQQIQGMFGLQVNSSLSENLLRLIAEKIGGETGIHVHLWDTLEIEHCKKLGYQGPVSCLNEFNLISDRALLVGDVLQSSTELKLIIQKGATLVNVPVAITQNQFKLPSLPLQPNLRIGIGTAGYHADILYALRQVYLLHRQRGFEQSSILSFIQTLLHANSAFAGFYFAGKPGILERGSNADIVVFDYIPATPFQKNNYLDHLLFGMSATQAKMVIVNGRFIYHNGSFLTLDEELILNECKKVSQRLWELFGVAHPVAIKSDLD